MRSFPRLLLVAALSASFAISLPAEASSSESYIVAVVSNYPNFDGLASYSEKDGDADGSGYGSGYCYRILLPPTVGRVRCYLLQSLDSDALDLRGMGPGSWAAECAVVDGTIVASLFLYAGGLRTIRDAAVECSETGEVPSGYFTFRLPANVGWSPVGGSASGGLQLVTQRCLPFPLTYC